MSSDSSSSSNKVFPLLDQLELSTVAVTGGQDYDESEKKLDITICWTNLKFLVEYSWLFRKVGKVLGQTYPKRNLVLKGISGQLKSGQLVAVMGPSGAGKSTLLESIVGRRYKGRIGPITCDTQRSRLKVAFVPQHDLFFSTLTVRECLMMSSKLATATNNRRSSTKSNSSSIHLQNVHTVLSKLGLLGCSDNKISRCSGGQQKRLSIAIELLGQPDVLVLDEPTSGLDAAACYLVIKLLKELVNGRSNMAIMLTIHQPSYRVLCIFNKLYVISKQGKTIYDGPPQDVVESLAEVGAFCPKNYNPAEFLIDVANGDLGPAVVMSLASRQEGQFAAQTADLDPSKSSTLEEMSKPGCYPFWVHFTELVKRSVLTTFRDPWLFGLRFGSHVFFALALGLQTGGEAGSRGGCPPKFDVDFDPSELEAIQVHNKKESDAVFDNAGAIFLGICVILFTSVLPTVLTLPLEMGIVVKEKTNGWYSVTTYFLAKTVADIPFQILFPFLFTTITYTLANQSSDVWRYLTLVLVTVMISFTGQSHGMLVGSIFMRNPTLGVYLAPFTMLPLVLFAGFFMKLKNVPNYFQPFAVISYVRYGLEAMLGALYGFGRCGDNIELAMIEARQSMSTWFGDMLGASDGRTGITDDFVQNLVKLVAGDFIGEDGHVRSSILNHYSITDSHVLPGILKICFIMVLVRLVCYLVVIRQANAKQ